MHAWGRPWTHVVVMYVLRCVRVCDDVVAGDGQPLVQPRSIRASVRRLRPRAGLPGHSLCLPGSLLRQCLLDRELVYRTALDAGLEEWPHPWVPRRCGNLAFHLTTHRCGNGSSECDCGRQPTFDGAPAASVRRPPRLPRSWNGRAGVWGLPPMRVPQLFSAGGGFFFFVVVRPRRRRRR